MQRNPAAPPQGARHGAGAGLSVNRITRPRLRSCLEYALPHRVAVQVALLKHGVRPRGGMDRRVLAVLFHEHLGGDRFAPTGRRLSYSTTSAIASRWSRRSVLTASLAHHRSALAMVIDALASALVTL